MLLRTLPTLAAGATTFGDSDPDRVQIKRVIKKQNISNKFRYVFPQSLPIVVSFESDCVITMFVFQSRLRSGEIAFPFLSDSPTVPPNSTRACFKITALLV
jgi:hypothetical protein